MKNRAALLVVFPALVGAQQPGPAATLGPDALVGLTPRETGRLVLGPAGDRVVEVRAFESHPPTGSLWLDLAYPRRFEPATSLCGSDVVTVRLYRLPNAPGRRWSIGEILVNRAFRSIGGIDGSPVATTDGERRCGRAGAVLPTSTTPGFLRVSLGFQPTRSSDVALFAIKAFRSAATRASDPIAFRCRAYIYMDDRPCEQVSARLADILQRADRVDVAPCRDEPASSCVTANLPFSIGGSDLGRALTVTIRTHPNWFTEPDAGRRDVRAERIEATVSQPPV